MNKRCIIFNADDFGQSPGINRGVIEAFEHGAVTSASLMVRWPAAFEAARYARTHPDLSIGIHIDFGEWAYRNGDWVRLYRVVDEESERAVSEEIARQLDAFERLMGSAPTHIDSHQHIHLKEPARTCVLEASRRLGVPVRSITPAIKYCGRFYGQDDQGLPYPHNISVDGLLDVLSALEPGVTEIGCHPAAFADLDTMYSSERLTELRTLCDSRIPDALAGIGVERRSFAGWGTHAVSNS